MKIEKINDNQIRCTLGKKDLADRDLKVSELAYGTDKAKELFRDMMQQASYEVGFEAEDIPLMIEAIPVNADCIVLIITKVDEPEELDTRFSRFSSDYDDEDLDYDDEDGIFSDMEQINAPDAAPSATDELDDSQIGGGELAESDVTVPDNTISDDVLNLFNKVKEYISSNMQSSDSSGFVPLKDSLADMPSVDVDSTVHDASETVLKSSAPVSVIRIFSFDSFDVFSGAAEAVSTIYSDKNSLYLDSKTGRFYLTLVKDSTGNLNYNKTCNILSEYGTKESMGAESICYFDEHFRCIIKDRAIQAAARYAAV